MSNNYNRCASVKWSRVQMRLSHLACIFRKFASTDVPAVIMANAIYCAMRTYVTESLEAKVWHSGGGLDQRQQEPRRPGAGATSRDHVVLHEPPGPWTAKRLSTCQKRLKLLLE